MAPNFTKSASDANGFRNITNKSSIMLEGSSFLANGHVILSDVPLKITATPAHPAGCFVGFAADEPRSRHVVPLGKLENIRFMSIFRFKQWWTTHWVGSDGRGLEHETQMLLLENSGHGPVSDHGAGRPYVVLLPIIEGAFRASLQPGSGDNVDLCVESGSSKVRGSRFRSSVYMHAGDDPFRLVKEAMWVVRTHLGTFKLLEEKAPPGIVDKFGWCTWDAFYLKVDPQGVREGVKGLVDGGAPPGFLLIDDGWQSICHDEDDPNLGLEGMNRTSAGEQMPCRLIKFEENYKFRDYESKKAFKGGASEKGMGAFVRDLKKEFESVEYVYVWHALSGYWGGLRPGMPGQPESTVVTPRLSPGLQTTMEDLAVDKIVSNGVGLVPPERVDQMYEGLHSHLESVGIDGVKIDVIHLLEILCEDYGGRVELAKAYYKALTSSIRKHFDGNGVIASMEHCNDFMLLGTQAIALGRVGDDFWCTDPSGDPNGTFWLQGCHMVHCAYNSLWMGNFIQPDWDMFQSTHPCAEFHAASRAISGGPIYVSDCIDKHNFVLLRRLVLPDGTILRCQHYALPTKDCLFEDPLHDGKTMLKIWNLNKLTGVLGAFNCQGGGWDRETRRNRCFPEHSQAIAAEFSPSDIEWTISGADPTILINSGILVFAVYWSQAKKLSLLGPTDRAAITLEPFAFELLTVSPVATVPAAGERAVHFAPIGLVKMLNSGGAIQSFRIGDGCAEVAVRGAGEMRAFASEGPRAVRIDGVDAAFGYEEQMVAVEVTWPVDSTASVVEYLF